MYASGKEGGMKERTRYLDSNLYVHGLDLQCLKEEEEATLDTGLLHHGTGGICMSHEPISTAAFAPL